jgi:hypothetical protein
MELGNLYNYPESTKGYQQKKKADKLASAGRQIIINADKFFLWASLKVKQLQMI